MTNMVCKDGASPQGMSFPKEYAGRYVAYIDDGTIVGVGKNSTDAFADAASKGHNDPILAYVPKMDSVLIY